MSDGTFTWARSPGGRVLSQSDGVDDLLAGVDRHGDLTFLFTAAGVVSDTALFDPFGDPLATTGTSGTSLGFQSDYTDPTSDHVWMGARWYDGGWAAFLSRDVVFGELSTPISLNRYTYGFANPLSFWDPDGRIPQSIIDDEISASNQIKRDAARKKETARFIALNADPEPSGSAELAQGFL